MDIFRLGRLPSRPSSDMPPNEVERLETVAGGDLEDDPPGIAIV